MKERKEDTKLVAQKHILDTINSEGWKLIEEHLKQSLTIQYKRLLKVKATELKALQDEIKITFELITVMYDLAGVKWNWDGYKEIKENISDEMPEERKRWEKYLESIRSK